MSAWTCSECGSENTKRRARGLCQKCYQAVYKTERYEKNPRWRAEESARSYQRHKVEVSRRTGEYNRQLKWEVIRKLGGMCACCGETTPEFLTVDHINGDGAAHRKALTGKTRASSIMIYKDIRRRGYPTDEFCILCMNCNHSIGVWGYCPHQSMSDTSRSVYDDSFVPPRQRNQKTS